MRHGHPSILLLAVTALVVGASISAGPVVWAFLAMAGPLIAIMLLTSRSVAHPNAHPGAVGHAAELRRAAMLRDREHIARAAADGYVRAHLDD